MLTERQIDEYRPSPVYPTFRLAYIMVTVFYAAFVLAGAMLGFGFRAYLGGLFLALVFIVPFTSALLRDGETLASRRTRYREYGENGYQVVWMLDANGELDNRIERRDHQNPSLNTSKYAVYEQLGGKRPRTFILEHVGPDACEVEVVSLAVRIISQRYLEVRYGSDSKDCCSILTLLRMLNSFGGQIGPSAFDSAYGAFTLVTTENRRLKLQVSCHEERIKELEKLEGASGSLAVATATLRDVRLMLGKRGIRLADVSTIITERLRVVESIGPVAPATGAHEPGIAVSA